MSKRATEYEQGKRKPQSIIAVAKAARVSTATVSRVLNGTGNVTPALELRVRKAIAATGYHLNTAARALSSGRSRTLGVLISDLRNPFFPELLQAFEEAAVASGYEVLVASTAYDLQRMSSCIDRMLERKVDGVALMTFGMEGTLLNRFLDRGVPLVSIDTAPPGANAHAIKVNYDAGMQQAVQHLAVLGHRSIAFVAGPKNQVSVEKRGRAFQTAMRAIGLPVSEQTIFRGDHTFASGQLALETFLALKTRPTAIICSNDLTAFGVMHAAETAGIDVPKDISLIGFDGIEIGAYMVPPLTSVRMSGEEIAHAAVEALSAMLERRQPGNDAVKTNLLVRRTTAPLQAGLEELRAYKTRGSRKKSHPR